MRKKELRQIEIKRSLFVLSRFSLWFHRHKIPLLAVILGVVSLTWLVFLPPSVLRKIDFWTYDSWLKRLPPLEDPKVIILSVDEASLKNLGPWPWPRKTHARVVERLKAAGAKEIVFDIVFSPARPGDETLAQSFEGTRVVLAAYTEDVLGFSLSKRGIEVSKLVLPASSLRKKAFALGHIALIFDEDGIVRRAPAFLADPKVSLPALGIAGALAFYDQKLSHVSFGPRKLKSPAFEIPLNPDGSFFIRYYGPRGSFPFLRVCDFLAGKIPPEVFKGRVVLIGVTAVGISDEWPTPYIDQGSLAGVEIHASIIQSLLQGDILYALALKWRFFFSLLLFGLCFGLVFGASWRSWLALPCPALIWMGGLFVFRSTGLFLGFSPYLGAWTLSLLFGGGAVVYQRWENAQRERRHQHYWQALLKRFSLKGAASYFLSKYDAHKVRLYLINKELLEAYELPFRDTPFKAGDPADVVERALKRLRDRRNLQCEARVDDGKRLYLVLEGVPYQRKAEISIELETIALLLRQRLLLQSLKKSEKEFIRSYLRLLEERSPELYEHSLRVAEITGRLAEALSLPEEEKRALHYAALLHDLGRIELPNREPWQELHPVLAADILGSVSFLRKSVVYIRHHHERYDGKGYPDGLRGEEIPLGARILALAEGFVETWEQLEKEYPDWEELEERILKIIHTEAGQRFDPHLVKVLEKEGKN